MVRNNELLSLQNLNLMVLQIFLYGKASTPVLAQ